MSFTSYLLTLRLRNPPMNATKFSGFPLLPYIWRLFSPRFFDASHSQRSLLRMRFHSSNHGSLLSQIIMICILVVLSIFVDENCSISNVLLVITIGRRSCSVKIVFVYLSLARGWCRVMVIDISWNGLFYSYHGISQYVSLEPTSPSMLLSSSIAVYCNLFRFSGIAHCPGRGESRRARDPHRCFGTGVLAIGAS